MSEVLMNYSYDEYRDALEGAGPKLKELILDRAAHDPKIDFPGLKALVEMAYQDGV